MNIKNGMGDGTLARVYSNNHLGVQAIVEDAIAYKSRVEQQAFATACHAPLTITTTETPVMVIYNGEQEKSIILNSIYISSNGGNTNFNRMIISRMYKNSSAPTGAILTGVPISWSNLNFGSPKVTSAVSYLWDTTGTGLTGASAGSLAMQQYFGPGLSHVPLAGSVIISSGQYVRITLQGIETSSVLLTISGYLSKAD